MAKAQRVRRMKADEFSEYCANASANDVQKAIDTGSEWDYRAFISAAKSNTDSNVIWVLLREARKSGINLLNVRSKGDRQTALHWAAAHNDNPDVVRVLISAGANVSARDSYEQTPLTKAESVHRMRWKDNRLQVINMLKNAGAK